MQPRCESPTLSIGEMCVIAAEILEAPLRRVIPLALESWRTTIRSFDAEVELAARQGNAIGAYSMSKGREEAIKNIEEIILLAARIRIQRAVQAKDVYALYVIPAFESVVVRSVDSADSLQRAHEDGVREAVSKGHGF